VVSNADEDEKSDTPRSPSKRLGRSAASSKALKRRLTLKKLSPEMTARDSPPEIQAAQQLLARIAARIIAQKV
jgi:hypothetical protein